MHFYHIILYSYYSYHLFIIHLRIYYLLYYSFTYFTIHLHILLFICVFTICYSLFTIHYSLFTIYHLLFNIYYLLLIVYCLLFTIYYLLFIIYYLLFTIHIRIHLHIYYLYTYLFTYLDENPYLVEFDETPIFWYPRVARDAWINFASCSDQFRRSESRISEKKQNI